MNRHVLLVTLLGLLLALSALFYLPGISGPYIFDDTSNLLGNSYIKIRSLDSNSLYHAAFSLESGPLQRPISMLSFALNYYFAGGFSDSTPFKVTNLVIHAINGLLVFWLMQLVLTRLASISDQNSVAQTSEQRQLTALAFVVALLWLIHPIQISSVLYVVQRMTELSALFTLAGLIAYLLGRSKLNKGQTKKASIFLIASLGLFLPLGLLSKENAVLLPVYILVLEFVLFPSEPPWKRWHTLTQFQRRMLVAGLTLLAVSGTVAIICYALPMYAGRKFDLTQRLLTEGRVLFFYLSLLLLPRIDGFGNQHDDIAISVSLLDPWTTLPALLGNVGLLVTAVLVRKRLPFLSLGILWYYAGHLLESTVIALEIAHEHRNYLPTLGVMLVIVGGLRHAVARFQKPQLFWLIPAIVVVFAGVTLLRASQWGSMAEFYRSEVQHHPGSARNQAGYARLMTMLGHDDLAINALNQAIQLEPLDTGYRIQIAMLQARHGEVPSKTEQEKILSDLRSDTPLTTTTVLALQDISGCLTNKCQPLQIPMEQWLREILNRKALAGDKSFFHYVLGLTLLSQAKVNEAIHEFHMSHELDPSYLHPLFVMATIYIQLGTVEGAEDVLNKLHQANRNNPHPRTQEISDIEEGIKGLKARRK